MREKRLMIMFGFSVDVLSLLLPLFLLSFSVPLGFFSDLFEFLG